MSDLKASEKIGTFVASARVEETSDDLMHRVGRAFVDTFAVAAGGRSDPASRIARDYALSGGGASQATLWTTRDRVRAEEAALANAVMAHVLDYDDVASPLRGHPSVVLLPALVALGEAEGPPGGR